ncbi:DNA polymerase IV [Streptomyces sp. APSN-46.1]|uniref:DNA polymerase IV n=1 Tax=Streptomyces sp. APSN-46.1 TaxID=2929049 RepID=UPI001FB1EF83|nr:DNA polymerase IV [Streptomyces sp. APSN-46.1]MCJ1677007.1 DNA polymerase IV [Streptomyces sp. APSN-46.1]
MRAAPTILHLDMDAFYASVEQASKPSLRGKPVIVGGLGPRGVVATASYEARRFGVHSAMPMAQARRLCPNGACLIPRFTLYRSVSEVVMGLLRKLSPLVEPLSLDEAFVDLEAGGTAFDAATARETGERLRADILAATGLSGSVGLAGSKMLAKVASEEAKPDGLLLIEPGTERELLAPMSVRTLPGVGPATGEHLRRAGITTVGALAEAGEDELVRMLGRSHGVALYRMALGLDDRPVVAERDAKSVSVEDTFDVDLHDRVRIRYEVRRLADRCVGRLRESGYSGRTIVLKVRRYDFSTLTRSETLRGPTDDAAVVREAAARLLEGVDTTGGVRLLGVGVSGLADYTQEDLFAQAEALAADVDGESGMAGAGRAAEPGKAAAVDAGAGPMGGAADGAHAAGAADRESWAGAAEGASRAGGVSGGDREGRADAAEGASGASGAGGASGADRGSRPDGAEETSGAGGVSGGDREGRAGGAEGASGVGGVSGGDRGSRAGGAEGAGGGVGVSEGGGPGGGVPERRWAPGSDVRHAVYGPGWVQGSGVGRVTVRFERPGSEPGRVRTFRVDDPELEPSDPLPLVGAG